MDGVLADSERYICEAAVRMFSEYGVMVSPDDFLPFVGSGEDRYLGGVAGLYQLEFNLAEAKKRTYEIYEKIAHGRLLAFPGTFEFIETCRERGLRLALATSADSVKVRVNLRELDLDTETFDVIVSGEGLMNRKPHPEVFLKAAEALRLPASDCLVIEDAVNGVKAAKAAGMTCLALTTSFSREELDEAGADWIARDLSAVSDEIFRLLPV